MIGEGVNRLKSLIVIPAYNEAGNLRFVLESLLQQPLPADIVVVDDGSADATSEVAKTYPIRLVKHPCNLGLGCTLQTGYRYALRHGYDYVVQVDGDGQHHAEDAATVLRTLRESQADLVIGSRFLEGSKFQTGPLKGIAIWWFRLLIQWSTGVHITDPTSGLQGMSARVLRHYAESGMVPTDFPDADFVTDVILEGFSACEVPVGSYPRQTGRSMHSGIKPIIYIGKVTLSTLAVVLAHVGGRRGRGVAA